MAVSDSLIDQGPFRGAAVQGLNVLTTLAFGQTVGVFDSDTLLPVFYGAQPMRVRVRETSRVMSHPLETGVTISDHHVIEPKEIEIPFIIPDYYYISVYQQIKTAFLNAELLIVQSNADVYTNMIVAEMPHEETPDMNGVLVMDVRFKEVQFVAPSSITAQNNATDPTSVPSNYSPEDPVNGNMVLRGNCTAVDPTGIGAPSAPLPPSTPDIVSRFLRL